MSYDFILFDLDGTLTDSGPGILNALGYTFDRLGLAPPDEQVKRRFIGPPLLVSFQTLVGLDEPGARRAIGLYREYYRAKGIYENEPYPGVREMLSALKTAGKRLAVASTKPQAMVETVLTHFDLARHFDAYCGALADDESKADVIARATDALGALGESTIMVGDRHHDVTGAHERGLPCVGVTWGYAEEGEFARCGADFTADSPQALTRLLTAD